MAGEVLLQARHQGSQRLLLVSRACKSDVPVLRASAGFVHAALRIVTATTYIASVQDGDRDVTLTPAAKLLFVLAEDDGRLEGG